VKFGYYSQIKDHDNSSLYADLLDDLREQVVFCEQAGFDIAYPDEHHFTVGYTDSSNPIVAGAMLAAHTDRIRIGLPVILANWQPLRLAEDVSILDHLTRGRVEIAMGRGGGQGTVFNLNPDLVGLWPARGSARYQAENQTASREHFTEVLEVLKKAWTEEFFSHEGRFYKFPQSGLPWEAAGEANPTAVKDGEVVKICVTPRPFQKPYPPLRMLMNSDPSFQEGARLGLKGWAWIMPPRNLRRRLEEYSAVRTEREGRHFRVGEDVTALRLFYVAPTYEEAKRDADRLFSPYLTVSLHGRPVGHYVDEGDDSTAKADTDWEAWRKRLMIIAGSPEQVAEQIHELGETCGLDSVVLWSQASSPRGGAGLLTHKQTMSSLELFASKVMPYFANGESEKAESVEAAQA
jgi:alkanesulfonate monooxygenase SsuD/methylene tetrahydromethanopterin reductase-like flavin-dependent oxidoreductase (luciferase family)